MLRFRKAERLKKKSEIDALFDHGHTFFEHPFKVLWLKTEQKEAYPVQIGVSVPKKLFKRAVDRNLLKRRIREAYRQQKEIFYKALGESEKAYSLMLIYTDKEFLEYEVIEKKIIKLIKRLLLEFSQKGN